MFVNLAHWSKKGTKNKNCFCYCFHFLEFVSKRKRAWVEPSKIYLWLDVTDTYFFLVSYVFKKDLNNGKFSDPFSSWLTQTCCQWLHIFHKKKLRHDASKSSLSFLTVFGSTFYFSLMSSQMLNIFMPSWNFMDLVLS